jgi:hypothetical protein
MRQGARVILIQHSAHIPPGRDGLFNLIRSTPATLKYEPGLIVAENDYVVRRRDHPFELQQRQIRIAHRLVLEHVDRG